MVEEEKDAKANAHRIGDFQNRKIVGWLACDLEVNLPKKGGNIHIIIKGHDGKGGTEECGKADKDDLAPAPYQIGYRFLLIRYDKIRLANDVNIKGWLLLLDFLHQIYDRHHIPSRAVRIQIGHGHNPKTV